MKKVFLTAVAGVAFSNLGNANQSVSFYENSGCLDLALKVYQGTLTRTGSTNYATELATWAYNDCLNWE